MKATAQRRRLRLTSLAIGCALTLLASCRAEVNVPGGEEAAQQTPAPSWRTVPLHNAPFGNALGLGYSQNEPNAVASSGGAAVWFTPNATIVHDGQAFSRHDPPPEGSWCPGGELELFAGSDASILWRMPTWEIAARLAGQPHQSPLPIAGGVLIAFKDRIEVHSRTRPPVTITHGPAPTWHLAAARDARVVAVEAGAPGEHQVTVYALDPKPHAIATVPVVDEAGFIMLDGTGTWLAMTVAGTLYRVVRIETGAELWAAFPENNFVYGQTLPVVLDAETAQAVLAEARDLLRQGVDLSGIALGGREPLLAGLFPEFPSSIDGRTWTWPERVSKRWDEVLAGHGPVRFDRATYPEPGLADLIFSSSEGTATSRWDLSRGTWISTDWVAGPYQPERSETSLGYWTADEKGQMTIRGGEGGAWKRQLPMDQPWVGVEVKPHPLGILVANGAGVWLLSEHDGRVLAKQRVAMVGGRSVKIYPGPADVTVVVGGEAPKLVRLQLPSLDVTNTIELNVEPLTASLLPEDRGVLVGYVDGTAQVISF